MDSAMNSVIEKYRKYSKYSTNTCTPFYLNLIYLLANLSALFASTANIAKIQLPPKLSVLNTCI